MPTFTYTSRDPRGQVQTGNIDAINEDEVVAVLQQRGLIVTSVFQKDLKPQVRAQAPRAPARRMHGRVTVDDHVVLCQQLATLIEAGVPLLRALDVVSKQVESRKLLLALEDVRRDVSAGRTLRESLAKFPAIFDNLWLNLVETGEASGHLAGSLKQLARHFESARHLRDEATTAMTYPMFLIGMAGVVVLVFVYWLIPKFTIIFTTMGEGFELPLVTRIVVGISDFARDYVLVVMAGAGVIGFLLWKYLRTEAGQWTRDRVLVFLPLFKTLVMYLQLAEFSRGLSTLLGSGVPLLTGLEILGRSATNKLYGQAIHTVRDSVKEGKTMAEPMERSGRFPAMMVQMVQVGEEVGELGKMMDRIAQYYEERMQMLISRMTRLFEPVAIIVMAIIVLFIVLAIFMPIFQFSTSVKF